MAVQAKQSIELYWWQSTTPPQEPEGRNTGGFSRRATISIKRKRARRSTEGWYGAEGQTVEAGVAESLDRRGNPRSPLAESQFVRSSHFVSLCRVSAPLIASANTGITPDSLGPPPGLCRQVGTGKKGTRRLATETENGRVYAPPKRDWWQVICRVLMTDRLLHRLSDSPQDLVS